MQLTGLSVPLCPAPSCEKCCGHLRSAGQELVEFVRLKGEQLEGGPGGGPAVFQLRLNTALYARHSAALSAISPNVEVRDTLSRGPHP